MAPDIIQLLKASAYHQLCLALLLFTHARSESINADRLVYTPTSARKKEWWPATADSLPHMHLSFKDHSNEVQHYCEHCDTHYVSRHRTHNLTIVSPTRYQ